MTVALDPALVTELAAQVSGPLLDMVTQAMTLLVRSTTA